jgi:hypothetical protein
LDYLAHARLIRAMADGVDAFARAVGATAGFDAARFLEFVRVHRLVAWIAPGCAHPDVASRLTPSQRDALEGERVVALARAEEVVEETFEAVEALETAGIEVRALKGVVHATRFYGDVTRRFQRDVDVLVRPADFERAFATIERLGYRRDEGRIGDGAVRWGFRRGRASLDLHRGLRRRARRRIDVERLFDAPVPCHVRGRALSTLSDDFTLTFLLLAMCGDLERGGCRARHLLDLHLALRTLPVDPDAFLARRAAQGLEAPCVNALAVFLGVFGATEASEGAARAVERRRRRIVVADAAEAVAVASRGADDPANRRWFQRAYPYDELAAWARRLTVDLPWAVARRFRRGFEVPRDGTPR